MAIGVESRGESYGLLIDLVGEVMRLPDATLESNPVNLDAKLASVSAGVHRLDEQLMVILDVDRVLDTAAEAIAA
jgi:purine-binding chemotaxis protein CheW